MFDVHQEIRFHREAMARLERDLERRRHLPARERRSPAGIRFRGLRYRSVAPGGGAC